MYNLERLLDWDVCLLSRSASVDAKDAPDTTKLATPKNAKASAQIV